MVKTKTRNAFTSYLLFPSDETHVFIAMNIGTSIYSPIFEELEQLSSDVFDIILAE